VKQCVDYLLFKASMAEFLEYKNNIEERPSWLNWTDNGCSKSADFPLGFNFLDSCKRHDFGYRNYRELGLLEGSHRKAIDKNFRQDLRTVCEDVTGSWRHRHGHLNCLNCMIFYYRGVRIFGGIRADGEVVYVPRIPGFAKPSQA
jgi:hypothetical protein